MNSLKTRFESRLDPLHMNEVRRVFELKREG